MHGQHAISRGDLGSLEPGTRIRRQGGHSGSQALGAVGAAAPAKKASPRRYRGLGYIQTAKLDGNTIVTTFR